MTFDHINNYRQSLGLPRLAWNERAYQLCNNHNNYQAQRNQISHDNFGNRAKQLKGATNENVACTWGDNVNNASALAWKFFTMWKNSPGHDKNMRDRNMRAGAVAAFYAPNNRGVFATNMNLSG